MYGVMRHWLSMLVLGYRHQLIGPQTPTANQSSPRWEEAAPASMSHYNHAPHLSQRSHDPLIRIRRFQRFREGSRFQFDTREKRLRQSAGSAAAKALVKAPGTRP